jgi:hypothetical protein
MSADARTTIPLMHCAAIAPSRRAAERPTAFTLPASALSCHDE